MTELVSPFTDPGYEHQLCPHDDSSVFADNCVACLRRMYSDLHHSLTEDLAKLLVKAGEVGEDDIVFVRCPTLTVARKLDEWFFETGQRPPGFVVLTTDRFEIEKLSEGQRARLLERLKGRGG